MPPLSKDIEEAGRIYRSTGAIAANSLRPEIYRAWERSHIQGANPRALKAEQLSNLETERLLEQQKELISAARPYCRLLSQAAGTERHAVMLGDEKALVLDIMGHEQSIKGPEAVPPPGSLLSEAFAGVNGIGTPLAEGSYAEIIAAEHFIEGFHPFTCQGIPLHNNKQETIGVLSVSVRRAEVGQKLKEILLCASHGIEAELLHKRLEEDVRRVLAASPNDYQPLEDLRQDIVQAHHTARMRLEVASRLAAKNSLDYPQQLIQQAETSIQLFRDRAQLWQDLASLETGEIKALSLTQSVSNLIHLLATEAAIRKVEVVACLPEEIAVAVDAKSFLRALLRYFMQAFELAGKGGTVAVAATKIPNSQLAELRLTPLPSLGIAKSAPNPIILKLASP